MRLSETHIARGVTDYETRLDYAGRTDDQPVYVGRAPQGAPTSASIWMIERIEYDASDRPIRKAALANRIWDDRAELIWG